MTFTSCFTDVDQVVLRVSNLSDCCTAIDWNHSHFAGWHTKCCIFSFFRHKLCTVSCCTNELSAVSRIKFNVVYQCTNRDIFEFKTVSDSCFCCLTIHNLLSDFQTSWCKDICFLAVCIADQCDVCCSVWIVFDALNCCRNSILISLKVDDSIFSSRTASAMSDSDLTLCVTSRIFLNGSCKGFLRS